MDWVARGLSYSGDGFLVASTLRWLSALLLPWGGEGGGGGNALVNVGSCDVRETSWTASCWFALALQERDEAMMLSQLTFRESESFD
jgi:hypothetical protein